MVRWFFALALLLTFAIRPEFVAMADDSSTVLVDDSTTADDTADEEEEEADEAETDKEGDDEEGNSEETDESEESDKESKEESDDSSADDEKDADAADEKDEDDKPSKESEKEESEAKSDEKASDEKAKTEKSDKEEKKPAEKKADKEKSDDDKPKEEKSTEEKKPAAEEKKPETHKVEKKDLKIETEVEGVFVAKEVEEVPLRPEVWSSFKVVEAVAHGKRVRKGDVLVKFDDKDIEEAIAEKSLQQRLGELALMAAEEEFPRMEKSVELAYESAERDRKQTLEEQERFNKTMRELSEKLAKYYLKSSEQDLDNAREELDQLKKMYEADELTEETEEIVLKRQEFQVKSAEFFVEYSKINHDYTMNVTIPRRAELLKTAVREANLAFERAKMTKSLGLSKERYDLEVLRETRARSIENHAKLVEDRGLMTLKAPADGVAYYGRSVNGRWIEVSGMETKLIPFGMVTPNSVVMTIVKDRPMYVETSIGEKELPTVKSDQEVTIVPVSDDEVELKGAVEKVADVPGGGNKFAVQVEIKSDDAPKWLMPGMTAKAKIKTYEVENAVVVPAELVQSDADEPKTKYVMLQVEDEEKPVRREIKLGKSKDKNVEVLKGLKEGDLIVKGAKDEKGEKDDAAKKDEVKKDAAEKKE